jgi:glycosyltransferase involved in cell wall biosynthesis
MKVLHVIPSLSPSRGGPGIVLRQIMTGLSMNGVIVHTATTDDDGPDAFLQVPHGVAVSESGGECFYFARQTRFYSFSWPLTRWLSRHIGEYDVVHIHALFSYPSTAAAYLARRARVPYLLRPLGTLAQWGLSSRRPLLKRLSLTLNERRMLRGAAAVQATSEQERAEVLTACPDCRAVVIPNPVAMPSNLPARPFRNKPAAILFLSRLDPKKGLEVLLNAFDRVAEREPDIRLTVAGGGIPDYVASIRRLAESLAARDRVSFTGEVNGERKDILFADADLFVLPSRSENFGVAVAEAMAHAVPVLISQDVGIHIEVTGADAGRTAPCETEPLADAIRQMLSDPAGLRRMGENGRQFALGHYSGHLIARLLLNEYETAMRQS